MFELIFFAGRLLASGNDSWDDLYVDDPLAR